MDDVLFHLSPYHHHINVMFVSGSFPHTLLSLFEIG